MSPEAAQAPLPPTGEPPLVSVVLPVRDGLPYLRDSVESILGQTLSDLELVVVDDGSVDGSAEMLAAIPDHRLRVIAQDALGVAAARNAGLAASRGEFLAVMDADDISLPQRLEVQVRFLRGNADVAVVGSWFQEIDPTGAVGRVVPPVPCAAAVRAELFVRCPIAHGTVLARRRVLVDVGGYRGDGFEDYDLWCRIAAAGWKITNLPAVLYRYRRHDGNLSVVHAACIAAGAERVRSELWQRLGAPRLGWRETLQAARRCPPASRVRLLETLRLLLGEACRRRRPMLAGSLLLTALLAHAYVVVAALLVRPSRRT